MYITQSIQTETAFRAIQEFLETNSTYIIENKQIPEKLIIKAACFVTIKTKNNKLRGCIGTLYPVYENLYTEIIKNAVASAVRDYRFNPLKKSELEDIKISVEVLYPPEKIKDLSLLNPKLYGAIISDRPGRKGVLLPNIEGVDTIDKQIEIIKRKAGINQKSNKNLTFYRFKTEKYY